MNVGYALLLTCAPVERGCIAISALMCAGECVQVTFNYAQFLRIRRRHCCCWCCCCAAAAFLSSLICDLSLAAAHCNARRECRSCPNASDRLFLPIEPSEIDLCTLNAPAHGRVRAECFKRTKPPPDEAKKRSHNHRAPKLAQKSIKTSSNYYCR